MRLLLIRSVLVTVLLAPAALWAFVKPVRILAPEYAGVTCIDTAICIDDPGRLEEARQLYSEAVAFVEAGAGHIEHAPTAVFCSTKACSERFGLYNGHYDHAAAYNVGTAGIVIGYRGWHPHYIRHELIHHLQNERLGSLDAWLFKPKWFIEGMAYSLSEDPRDPLPERLERWRHAYDAWAGNIDPDRFWKAAATL